MNNRHQPMRTVWHSLLWKEWHEHKWKLVSLTAILIAALLVFGSGDLDSHAVSGMAITLFCYCVLAGMFLGMSTAGSESGRKTLPILQSLPTPMWQPAITKLLMTILTVVFPLLILAVVLCVWWTLRLAELQWETRPRDVADLVAAGALVTTLGVSSLVLWMAAAGINRSDEIRAGAVGFLVICAVWFVLAYSFGQAEKRDWPTVRYGLEVLFAAAPGGAGAGLAGKLPKLPDDGDWWSLFPYLLSAVIGHGCVLAWYLRRFGRVVARPARTEGNASSPVLSKNQQLGPPRRSQLTAIAWKQFWETGPLALVTVVIILVVATVVYLFDDQRMSVHEFGEGLAGVTLSMAFFVTIVAGIGVFLEDLKPGVDDFWRSRPINFSLWFGVKFVVGLAVLVAAFGTLLLFANGLTDSSLLSSHKPHPGLLIAPHRLLQMGYAGWVFLLIYTLSMAAYCIFRQPIYAAVLTIGLLIGGMFALDWVHAQFFAHQSRMHWSVAMVLMLLLQAIATALAWLAVRHDWQWRRS